MSSGKKKAITVGLFLGLLCVLGRLTHLLPFSPAVVRWSLQEVYTQGEIPKAGSVRQSHSARSNSGLVIGVDGPGFVEWRFAHPGPFPTLVQPFFDPAPGQAARITIASPHHAEPRVLLQNLPVHNRPLDISAYVKEDNAFAIRFEGTGARLEDIRYFELSEEPPVPWAVGLVFLLMIGLAIRARNKTALLVIGLVVIGFSLRWVLFGTYFSLPLEGDATEYWSLGQTFQWQHPFMTSWREPGFIWWVHAAKWAFGDSERSARFLGVLTSLCWIPLTVELALAAGWPFGVGLAAAALVATNPFAIFMSAQGYQLEFFTLLILIFAVAWLRNRSAVIGWVGGLLCITRVQSFAAVLPLVLLVAWRYRWDKRRWSRFLVPFLLLTFPYLAAARAQTGSILGHLTRHAGWYERMEAKDLGKTEPARSALGLHHFLLTPGQPTRRIKDLIKGYGSIFLDPRDPYNRIFLNSHYALAWNLLFFPFFWVGVVKMLKNTQDRRFLWLPLLFLGVLPMLHNLIREPRLLFHIEPFVALIVARGFAEIPIVRSAFKHEN